MSFADKDIADLVVPVPDDLLTIVADDEHEVRHVKRSWRGFTRLQGQERMLSGKLRHVSEKRKEGGKLQMKVTRRAPGSADTARGCKVAIPKVLEAFAQKVHLDVAAAAAATAASEDHHHHHHHRTAATTPSRPTSSCTTRKISAPPSTLAETYTPSRATTAATPAGRIRPSSANKSRPPSASRSRPASAKSYHTVVSSAESVGPSTSNPTTAHHHGRDQLWSDDEDDASAIIDKLSLKHSPRPASAASVRPPQPPATGRGRGVGGTAAAKLPILTPVERIANLYSQTAWIRTVQRNATLKGAARDAPPPPRTGAVAEPMGGPEGSRAGGRRGEDPSLSTFLSLDQFDSTEPDRVDIAGLLEQLPEGVPAHSMFYHLSGDMRTWEPCRVVGVNEDESYRIVWEDDGKAKSVHRMNLAVDGLETPAEREVRIATACRLRDAAEREVREALLIAEMDDSVVDPMDSRQVSRILAQVAFRHPKEGLSHVVERNIDEMREMHNQASKQSVYNYKMLHPRERLRLQGLNLPDHTPVQEEHDLLGLKGTVDHPGVCSHSNLKVFRRNRQFIADNLFFAHGVLYHTLYKLVAKWNGYQDRPLFDPDHPRLVTPCEVADFRDHQTTHLFRVTDRLKKEWTISTVSIIQNDLVGFISFYDDDIEKYNKGRMKRFLRVVNMMMGHQLRVLVNQALATYTEYVLQYLCTTDAASGSEGGEPQRKRRRSRATPEAGFRFGESHPPEPLDEAGGAAAPPDEDAAVFSEDFLALVGAGDRRTGRTPDPPVMRVALLPKPDPSLEERRRTEELRSQRRSIGFDPDDEAAPPAGSLEFIRARARQSSILGDVEKGLNDMPARSGRKSLRGRSVVSSAGAVPEGVAQPNDCDSDTAGGTGAPPPLSVNGTVSLFRIRLTTDGQKVVFDPPLDDIDSTLRSILDSFFKETDDIVGVGDQLFPLLQLQPFQLTAHLKGLDATDPTVVGAHRAVEDVLASNCKGPQKLQQLYQMYEYLLAIDVEKYLEEFYSIDPAPTLEDYDYICKRLQADSDAVATCSLNEVSFTLVKVECYEVKRHLCEKAKTVINGLMARLTSRCNDDIMTVDSRYTEILNHIRIVPETPEELQKLKAYVDSVPTLLRDLSQDFESIAQTVQVLSAFGYIPEQKSFETYWATYSRPKKIVEELQDSDFRYRENRNRFMQQLRDSTDKLVEDVVASKKKVELLAYEDDETRVEDMYALVNAIRERLTEFSDTAMQLNTHERIFRMQVTKHSLIREVALLFEPYEKLWTITQQFSEHHEKWTNGSLLALQADEVESKATAWGKDLNKLQRVLANEAPGVIVRSLREKLEAFKPHIPLVTALLERGVKTRHWELFGKLVGRDGKNKLVATDDITLSHLLDMGLGTRLADVQSISEAAGKERRLEDQLEKMKAEWKGKQFTLKPYENTMLITSVDDIQQLVDDHLVKTQALLGSLDVRHIESVVRKWEATLLRMSSVIEEWLKCQTMWHYLEPIFASPDISRSMPAEATQFDKVDAMWKSVMTICSTDPRVEIRCSEERLQQSFEESNKALEYILKQLHRFLETKRVAFPRFYFLSSDDLIEIMSEMANPFKIQKHLKKCFEGISSIVFADNLDITHMESEEGEVVSLLKTVNPGECEFLAEVWLKRVEESMKMSVAHHAMQGIEDYATRDATSSPTARIEWMKQWPGQVVIAASQVHWAREVEDAIARGVEGLTAYATKGRAQMNALVECVRGPLPSTQRCTLQVMIVIEVHAVDIVAKDLLANGVYDCDDFNWQVHMRYYFDPPVKKKASGIAIHQGNASVEYGNEYLGNTPRLVITPLTDRCYRTLLGALHMSYGGAPEGPAGTGKTETTKDLAKALAKYCLVYNCSDQISPVEMAKMFRGLTASGSWACFDEFNRIEVQVLSVIAQQILSIQAAIAESRIEFDFEGTLNAMEKGCAIFITMNPGYAGRAELPDNLKALFRPVAMMVPDYALIGEISLFSCGFHEGRDLATKIVTCFKLCSEQLSSQQHYDYGMRAVKTVLTASGRLLCQQAADSTLTERQIVLKALYDVNYPKFLPEDLDLFRLITQDIFPATCLPEMNIALLQQGLIKGCEAYNLQPTRDFLKKSVEIEDTLTVRHGMMLVGGSYGGKTSCLKALAHAHGWIEESGGEGFHRVCVSTINPKSITVAQLYGANDAASEWTDGVLSSLFKAASRCTDPFSHWIVLDGPVDAVWIESMNTVLDDNKKLCLLNGDNIRMTDHMNMIFEVEDLRVASPATVSRCGMVYFVADISMIDSLQKSWLASLPATVTSHPECVDQLKGLLEGYLHPSVKFVTHSGASGFYVPNIEVSAVQAAVSFLKMLTVLLGKVFTVEEGGPNLIQSGATERDLCTWVDGIFLTALAWGVGGWLSHSGRQEFSNYILRKMKQFRQVSGGGGAAGGGSAPAGGRTGRTVSKAHLVEKEKEKENEKEKEKGDASGGDGKKEPQPGDAAAETANEGVPTVEIYVQPPAAEQGKSLFDFCFVPESGGGYQWVAWLQTQPTFVIPDDTKFHEIIVPTADAVRQKYFLTLLAESGTPVMLSGTTGTGKSLLIKDTIDQLIAPPNGGMSGETSLFISHYMQFSARTTTSQVRSSLELKVEKRSKGVIAPVHGKKCLVFIDDVSMPEVEGSGAQPALECIREWLDHGGWFDFAKSSISFKHVENMVLLSARSPEKNRVSQRVLRHFVQFSVPQFEEETLSLIFSTLFEWITQANRYPSGMTKQVIGSIVQASISVYHTVKGKFLPTPERPHYAYNLRDLYKVFQGMSQCEGSTLACADSVTKLWAHEELRVFSDRLVNESDAKQFVEIVNTNMQTFMRKQYLSVCNKDCTPIMYDSLTYSDQEEGLYREVTDMDLMTKRIERLQADHDAALPQGGVSLQLVIFNYVVEHVSRVSRIIKMPMGHALLVGLGGRGRQSCARLATVLADYTLFRIKAQKGYSRDAWRDDLRSVIRGAAGSGNSNPTTFLLSDECIKDEAFLEDISCLLNSGEIPSLFEEDEVVQILEAMARVAKEQGRRDLHTTDAFWGLFVQRCKADLHVVMCFSPVGATLRTRLREFPALVNCCTIDHFSPWPVEGLVSLGKHFIEYSPDIPLHVRDKIVNAMVGMHTAARDAAVSYQLATRHEVHVTPTAYLELLESFRSLLDTVSDKARSLQQRYANGIDQLHRTEQSVSAMQALLEVQQPNLVRMKAETSDLIEKIEKDEADADVTRQAVAIEERAANEKADEARKIKEACESVLSRAMPALNAALAQLQEIDKRQLVEIRSMTNPSDKVKQVMAAICVCLGVKPIMETDPGNPLSKKKRAEYWAPAKKLMSDTNEFLSTLLTYKDKDDLDPAIFETGTGTIQPFLHDKNFQPDKVRSLSKALAPVCAWVLAMEKYYQVEKRVRPKKAELVIAQQEFDHAMEVLSHKKEELQRIDEGLAKMREELLQTQAEKENLEEEYAVTVKKLDRAKKIIVGLGGEKVRYVSQAGLQKRTLQNVLGDSLLSATYFAYLAPFSEAYRESLLGRWKETIAKHLPMTADYSFCDMLGEDVRIEEWRMQGLPHDAFSTDNALIMEHTRRAPLLIDPQQQASAWLKERYAKSNIQVLSPNQEGYIKSIAVAVRTGCPVLLEITSNELDPALNPLLLKQFTRDASGQFRVSISEQDVVLHKNWTEDTPMAKRAKLLIATREQHPKFRPETAAKVTIIAFAITQEGLQNQLLSRVLQYEERDLFDKKHRNVRIGAQNKMDLKVKEDEILALLSEEGSILENEGAITALNEAQRVAEETNASQREVERILAQFDRSKKAFVDVSEKAACLYFCLAELHTVDPMYQYSLQWFLALFGRSLEGSKHHDSGTLEFQELDRNNAIAKHFITSFFKNVSRSLLACDSLLLAFLMACALSPDIPASMLRFLCTLGIDQPVPRKLPRPAWLPEETWKNLIKLSVHHPATFGTVDVAVSSEQANAEKNGEATWENWFLSERPLEVWLPDGWDFGSGAREWDGKAEFNKLLLVRALRPDALTHAVQQFIQRHPKLGAPFTAPPVCSIAQVYRESSGAATPFVFILTSGADPMVELRKLAEDESMSQKMHTLSLGQGMKERAERLIIDGRSNGWWVVLQNCHLYQDWMPCLERIISDYTRPSRAGSLHSDFRLWLTSQPCSYFPPSALMNGVKMMLEPPKGLRSNLLSSFSSVPLNDGDFYGVSSNPIVWKKLCFSLCFFHAVVQERRNYGPMGWNIPYGFNKTDLNISLQQLKQLVEGYEAVPYDALLYLTGQCNYGGRVTDDRDRRLLQALLRRFLNESVLEAGHAYDEEGGRKYCVPDPKHDEPIPHIEAFPAEANVSVFGFHPNADVSRNDCEARNLLASVLLAAPKAPSGDGPEERAGGGGDGGDGGDAESDEKSILADLVKGMLAKIPTQFDVAVVKAKFPVSYHESLNTVLVMEVLRYNTLLGTITGTLTALRDALLGSVMMTPTLEAMGEQMLVGKIPSVWLAASYPSLKPLSSFVADLTNRISYLQGWLNSGGIPNVFWLSGFFFTQAFLTGVEQNHARRVDVAIDTLCRTFTVIDTVTVEELTLGVPPPDGCYFHGLYLEGASWCTEAKAVAEARPRELYDSFPVVWMRLEQRKEVGVADANNVDNEYGKITETSTTVKCPLYRTSERRGVLSTTGHNSNYVMMFDLPVTVLESKHAAMEHWVLRGIALLCQLPF